MSREKRNSGSKWRARATGVVLLVAIGALQSGAVSRLVGLSHIKQAERLPPGDPAIEQHLIQARQADASNGRACWLLSKVYLQRALQHRAQAEELKAQANRAGQTGDTRTERFLALRQAQEADKSKGLFEKAEALAKEGARSFNTVESFMQLASIYFRQNRSEDAEPYLQRVARVKPDDIEAMERLGLIKLHLEKWDDLEALCDLILRRHPYSANAYYYKAFIATKEKVNREEYYLNLRQAYLMMLQDTGAIFFPRRNLEEIVQKFGLVPQSVLPADSTSGRAGH